MWGAAEASGRRAVTGHRSGAQSKTRDELVAAFWALCRARGLKGVSVRTVAEKAGYDRSTFYQHFSGIDGIVDELEARVLGDIQAALADSFSERDEARIVERMSGIYQGQGEVLAFLLSEEGDPRFAFRLKKTLLPMLMRELHLEPDGVESRYIAEFGLSAILGTLALWYRSDRDLPAGELVRMLRSMLTKGVAGEIVGKRRSLGARSKG
jgi:Transcriptional regulator